jgi:hypothetical protein
MKSSRRSANRPINAGSGAAECTAPFPGSPDRLQPREMMQRIVERVRAGGWLLSVDCAQKQGGLNGPQSDFTGDTATLSLRVCSQRQSATKFPANLSLGERHFYFGLTNNTILIDNSPKLGYLVGARYD